MARFQVSVIAAGSPTLDAFESALDTLLAPYLAYAVKAFDVVLTDQAPATTRFLRTVVDLESSGTILTSPFQVKAFQGGDEVQAISLLATFITANPTYFISPVLYRYSDQMKGQPNRVVLIVVYTSDGAGGFTNWQVGGGGGGGGGDLYTNATPVPTTIGGIAAGSTFLNQTMQQMWDALLYPYLAPTFSSFTISGIATTIEVGDTIPAAVTFLWATTNSANIVANSITIEDITLALVLASGLANDGTEAVVQPGSITSLVVASHLYRITGQNSLLANFIRNLTISWNWRKYYGIGAFTLPTEAQIEALATNDLSNTIPGSYVFAATGYKYICFSDAMGGQINTVKDQSTLFNVPMCDVTLDPAYSNIDGGGFYYALVSVTNTFGVVSNYRVYRTYNTLGGAITLLVT